MIERELINMVSKEVFNDYHRSVDKEPTCENAPD